MCDHDRHNSDLYIRPCFSDASTALAEIEKGRAIGSGICIREACHGKLHYLGQFLLSHAGKVIFVWLLMFVTFTVALKSTQTTSHLEELWLPDLGQVEQELSYTLAYLGEVESWNNLMVIQVAKERHHERHPMRGGLYKDKDDLMYDDDDYTYDDNMLKREALLAHLHIVKRASQVTVQLFDVTWRLKDLCQSATMPTSDSHYIDQIFENISPCNIITPLDCFWEGSKLLGPEYPVNIPEIGNKVRWTNLNPEKLLEESKSYQFNYDFQILDNYLKKAGITTAYQYKPCLDPNDVECPKTAPNKLTKELPDIPSLVNGGCHGYAYNYLHWPESLILGGIARNRTGNVRTAKAIQTVIQLMGTQDVYEFWQDSYKVHHIGWNHEKAALILDAWQKKFAQEVKRLEAAYPNYQSYPFSLATLNESLKQHTKRSLNLMKPAIIISLLLVYCMFMGQYMSVFGMIVLIMSSIAGLGFSALLGVTFNVVTLQVVPYLCIGISSRDLWILLHHYKLTKDTKQTIVQCTPNVVTYNLYLTVTFMAASLLPAPALRVFAYQCAILTLFNTVSVLVVFPAILSIDQRRKQALNKIVYDYMARNESLKKTQNDKVDDEQCFCNEDITKKVKVTPADFLLNSWIRALCLTMLLASVCLGVYKGYFLKFSLKLPDFLPKNCSDYEYLNVHEKYFGFYSFSTVTLANDYPLSQNLIKELHNSVAAVHNVVASEDMSWMERFQDYLQQLQREFDLNVENNCISSEKWYQNASEDAVLAYKLLANTGNVNYPIEKSEILQKKLVTSGQIDEDPFYNYFSVWYSNDPTVSFVKTLFRPHPKQFYGSKTEFDLKIPKTKPFKYIETQYYLQHVYNTEAMIEVVQEIRKISALFVERGIKNFPKGMIFAFYHQFIDICQHFGQVFGLNVLVSVLYSFLLLNLNAGFFVASYKLILVLSLIIAYYYFNMGMNLLFIVSLNLAVALLGRNIILLIEGFVTSIGNRDRRTRLTIEQNFWPAFQGNLSLLLTTSVFFLSEFDFIRAYFFNTIVSVVVIDMISSFFVLPVFLSCFGPNAMLIPLGHPDRISTPSPKPSPTMTRKPSNHHRSHNNRTKRHSSHQSSGSDANNVKQQPSRGPSLTTITEESGCSITVQPEVVVQTTYTNQDDNASSRDGSSHHVTTKVTATANIKVEVHSRRPTTIGQDK